tara:strand:- start:4056 stop:4184 length:129 start_codon:yes stop_codon:yes gene_type:complete
MKIIKNKKENIIFGGDFPLEIVISLAAVGVVVMWCLVFYTSM